jgi:transketolase
MRCLEQIRNDAAYHNAEIMIVSSGGGFGYGQLGMSHHATEDVGIMRPLPNVEIYVPGTPTEAKLLFPAIFERKNVKYVRLEKTGPDYEYINKTPLSDGFFMYRAGKDGVIFSMGTLLSEALRAAEKLALQGLEFSVCSLAVVKSSDTETRTGLRELISNVKTVATIEEHNIIGGIGSYLCEIISTSCLNIKVHRIGMKDCYSSVVGDQEFLRQYYGINEETLVSLILADHD